jgi:glycosyltransferase involved in cell wall biosynthesis
MDWCHREFSELAGILNADSSTRSATMKSDAAIGGGDNAIKSVALRAVESYRAGRFGELPSIIQNAQSIFPVLPVPLFRLLLAARQLAGEQDRIAMDFLDFGCAAVDAGQHEIGAEAIGSAFVEDAACSLNLVYQPAEIRRGTDRYEIIAGESGAKWPIRPEHRDGDRLRIGLLIPNLVDNVVAYTKRVLDFSKYLDAAKCDLHVYSTENMCHRARQLPCRHSAEPSEQWGRESLAILRQRGVHVYLAERNVSLIQAAHDVAGRVTTDGIEVLVTQAGPTMPIDWLACRLCKAPVKIHIHIGIPLYQRGIAVTLFDNAHNMERERTCWPDYAGDLRLMRQGTDIELLDAQQPFERRHFGLSEDNVLVGVLSNHLDTRLGASYVDVIIAALKQNPEARFVPIGGKQLSGAVLEQFRLSGVGKQIVHIPVQKEVGRILKMLDVFAAEFPVSGSQSVVEAMVCGIPVVAMRSSNTHVGSTGADIVGSEYAIGQYDPQAYLARLKEWMGNVPARRLAGCAMRMRAEREFSIRRYVEGVYRLGVDLLEQARKGRAGHPCAV